jgi:hypothetical protein
MNSQRLGRIILLFAVMLFAKLHAALRLSANPTLNVFAVQSHVLGVVLAKLQVFNRVVRAVEIDVMDFFQTGQVPSKMLLHDKLMVENAATTVTSGMVRASDAHVSIALIEVFAAWQMILKWSCCYFGMIFSRHIQSISEVSQELQWINADMLPKLEPPFSGIVC